MSKEPRETKIQASNSRNADLNRNRLKTLREMVETRKRSGVAQGLGAAGSRPSFGVQVDELSKKIAECVVLAAAVYWRATSRF